VFIDVAKAFDTVSQETLIRAASSHGAPSLLVNYLKALYRDPLVTLDGQSFVPCKRGVRQGDPLSPLLFILVMEEVMEGCRPDLHTKIGNLQAHALAYADDLVLFAPSSTGLKCKLRSLHSSLSKAGLQLNTAKCRTLTILANGAGKNVALAPQIYRVGNAQMVPLSDRSGQILRITV
jgi:hypothetical protein